MTLDINHTPSDDELTAILQLESIDCSNSRIISIDPLQHLTKLRKLNCSRTQLRSIEKLRSLRLLDELDISYTNIASIMPLSECIALWSLQCSNTPLSSLCGLENMIELSYLDCSSTKIDSLVPLSGLPKLQQISCYSSLLNEPETLQDLNTKGVEVLYSDTPLFNAEIGTTSAIDFDPASRDSLFEEAARVIVTHQQGSTSLLQRRLKLGYMRAGRLIDQLEHAGVVGSFDGVQARQVLIPNEHILEQFLITGEISQAQSVALDVIPEPEQPTRIIEAEEAELISYLIPKLEPVLLEPEPTPYVEIKEMQPALQQYSSPPIILPAPKVISSPKPETVSKGLAPIIPSTPKRKSLWKKFVDVIELITG